MSAERWQSFSYETEDGRGIAEYRVDGEEVVVRVGGRERRERINEGATAIKVARRMMSPP